jgi:hypothetical protein
MARALSDAQHHQNIIGWENALRGYTSTYWMKAQLSDQKIVKNNKKRAPWNTIFIRSLVTLHKKIWTDRNIHVHGLSIKEQHQKLRQQTLDKVRNIYQENIKLAPRYQAINTIPLDNRLRHTTQRLQQWIAQIEHQKIMTAYIGNNTIQLTLKEAFMRTLK